MGGDGECDQGGKSVVGDEDFVVFVDEYVRGFEIAEGDGGLRSGVKV